MLNICPYNWMSSSILSLNYLCFGLENLASMGFSVTPSHQFWSFCFLYREITMTTLAYMLTKPAIITRFFTVTLSYHIFLSVFTSNQVANHFCQMCSLVTQTAFVSRITLQILIGHFNYVVQA